MKRRKDKPLTPSNVVELLILNHGIDVPCYRCKVAFTIEDCRTRNIQAEHLTEKGLGGSDAPPNRALSHKACHAIVTNGHGATGAGSSQHKLAKVDRITGATHNGKKAMAVKHLTIEEKRAAKDARRSGKLRSAGFSKGYRPMGRRP